MAKKAATKKPPKPGVRSKAYLIAQEINSAIGKPVLKLGNDEYFSTIRIPTGSHTIDRVTGGGWPLGRHIEIFGSESSCKSYLCYKTMALAQARGNLCAVIDAEHTFDYDWFEQVGGNSKELITAQPKIGEDGIEAMMLLLDRGDVEVITVDSIAALSTKQESERAPSENAVMGTQARFMSQNLRRLTTMNQKTVVLWTNQQREKIGVFFGSPKVTSGGKAMGYYATMRLEMIKAEQIKKKRDVATKGKLVKKDTVIGYWVLVKNQKNKSSIPYLEGSFIFDNKAGMIDEASELIQLGLEDGLVEAKGSGPTQTKYTYEDYDGEVWEGNMTKFKEYFREYPDLKQELVECIQEETLKIAIPNNEGDELNELEEE